MKITLSGGNFGGQEVDWPEDQKTVTLADAGGEWVYHIGKSDDPNRAEFIGMKDKLKPADFE